MTMTLQQVFAKLEEIATYSDTPVMIDVQLGNIDLKYRSKEFPGWEVGWDGCHRTAPTIDEALNEAWLSTASVLRTGNDV